MENETIFIIIGIVLFVFISYYLCNKFINLESFENLADPERDSYCPLGYCNNDLVKEKQNDEFILKNFPSNKKSYCLGYDNPYIYPYNYNMNLNHPIDKFKFPSWMRQLDLEVNNSDGFPGYDY